jgi:thioesterase domain-containing protein/acyl carrier protein
MTATSLSSIETASSQPVDASWIADRLTTILGGPAVGHDEDFFEIGGDSAAAVILMTEIESATGRLYPIETLISLPTAHKLADRIAADMAGDGRHVDPLLLPVQTDGNRTPLFLIHGLLGQVFVAHYLRDRIEDRPVWGIRAADHDPDRRRPKSVAELANDYIAAIRSVRPVGPYVLGGYCAGTFIAWEMAQRLAALGEPVPLILAIDPPPYFGDHIGGRAPHPKNNAIGEELFRTKTRWNLKEYADLHPEFRWIRDDDAALSRAVQTSAALRQTFLDYRPRPYDGSVLFFCARNKGRLISKKQSPWRGVAIGRAGMKIVTDLHLEMFMPNNSMLGATIDRELKARNL